MTNDKEIVPLVATSCTSCDAKSLAKVCVACGAKVCNAHRGAGGGSYQNMRGQEGSACQDCIESGLAFERGLGPTIHRVGIAMERIGGATKEVQVTLATLDQQLLPAVMREVDERMRSLRGEIIEPTVDQVANRAEKLIEKALVETGQQLDGRVDKLTEAVDKTVNSLKTGIDGRIEKLTEAVDRLNPGKLLWQAGLVFGLVNVATIIAAVWIAKHL